MCAWISRHVLRLCRAVRPRKHCGGNSCRHICHASDVPPDVPCTSRTYRRPSRRRPHRYRFFTAYNRTVNERFPAMDSFNIFDTPISAFTSTCDTTPQSSWAARSKASSAHSDISFSSPRPLPRCYSGGLHHEMTDYSPRFNGIESRLFQIETQIKGIHALIERLVAQDNVVTRPDTPDAFDPFNTGYGPLDYVPPGANFFPRAVLHFDSAPMPRPAAPVPNTHTQTLVPPTPERGAVVGQHRKVEPWNNRSFFGARRNAEL